jgi:hypothetical protein
MLWKAKPAQGVLTEAVNAFLEDLVNCLAASRSNPKTAAMATRIAAAAKAKSRNGEAAPSRLPLCASFSMSISRARSHPGLDRLGADLLKIEPLLNWSARPAVGTFHRGRWPDGYINAVIVGEAGIEDRGAIKIGVSLMAPHVQTPDRYQPPEGMYLAMTAGRYKQGNSSWVDLGVGETFYNEPNAKHALASNEEPFLVLWALWDFVFERYPIAAMTGHYRFF